MVTSAVLSVVFRLSGALSKFILFLYWGRLVEPAEIGLFGIIYAIVAIFVQLVGVEFHYVNSREIASSSSKEHASRLIRGQIVLHLFSYVIAVPVLSLVFFGGILDWLYFYLIACLVVVEHLCQELFRFLQFCFRPVLGAFVSFIRSGIWVFIFIYVVEYNLALPTIKNVLYAWLSCSFLAVLIGTYFIRDYLFGQQEPGIFTFKWACAAIQRASPFFISAIFFSLFQYMDRFILNYILGPNSVGVYFFLASLASALQLIVSFSVGVFYGPLAIRAFRQEGLKGYLDVRTILIKKSLLYCFAALIPAVLVINPVLSFIGKPDYIAHVEVYYIMLIANVAMIIADFSNLELYVRNLDREIMLSAIFGLIASLVIQTVSIISFGVVGAAIGAILSAFGIMFFRRLLYSRAIVADPILQYSPRTP